MVTVKMEVVETPNSPFAKFTVRATHPIHGQKSLIGLSARQVTSKGQQYRRKAEELFLRRCGSSRQCVQFAWAV